MQTGTVLTAQQQIQELTELLWASVGFTTEAHASIAAAAAHTIIKGTPMVGHDAPNAHTQAIQALVDEILNGATTPPDKFDQVENMIRDLLRDMDIVRDRCIALLSQINMMRRRAQ